MSTSSMPNPGGVGKDYMASSDPESLGLKIDVGTTGPDSAPEGKAYPDDVARVLNAVEPEFGRAWLIPLAGESEPSPGLTRQQAGHLLAPTIDRGAAPPKPFHFFGVPRPPETLEGRVNAPPPADVDIAELYWFDTRATPGSFRHSLAPLSQTQPNLLL